MDAAISFTLPPRQTAGMASAAVDCGGVLKVGLMTPMVGCGGAQSATCGCAGVPPGSWRSARGRRWGC